MRLIPKIALLLVLLVLPVRADGLSLRLTAYDSGKGWVRFTLKVENLTHSPVQLSQPTSQTHDFAVSRDGKEIWRWSQDKLFLQMLTERVVQPGETLTYTGDWTLPKPLPPGKYSVEAWLPVVGGGTFRVAKPLNM